ncbi:hypothetical protein N0V83_002590 [Neocucurbitaria cava]|uniref:Bifunctional lycopene cyclase/phytoene synthase n=1 Tax=Neocucurbitaria cava TaxID=798079 RepID=A0A9W8YD19_9PLEO|nr:hypothetical protein N0V83_002590 [Neocucurbitaria cava]
MGFEYALVHLKYTIPPAVLLTLLYRPLFTKLDAYKIAVVATIPWDSYLIRNRIWSYPTHVIVGPKLFEIPLEEVFFFVVQTYNTSLLYLILSKPTFQPVYLQAGRGASRREWRYSRFVGQVLLLAFILGLPWTNTVLPIILPTLYLWGVDTLALRRGTWVISTGTKYGVHLWDGLEIEEALFFLITNMLIVFGQLAFDNALAVLYTFPKLFANPPLLPSPAILIRALLTPCSEYDDARLTGLKEAVHRLQRKSRSFYLASSTFPGLLRTDLLLLYSFCRVADDLVDNASTAREARDWIAKLHDFLDNVYSNTKSRPSVLEHIRSHFPADAQSALLQLPVAKLSPEPLRDLLHGFEMDLAFNTAPVIETEEDLRLYSERVAGTVAQMCIQLIFHLYPSNLTTEEQRKIVAAGNRMGVALQYINIARDVCVDAQIGRVYLPSKWLAEVGLTYNAVIDHPQEGRIESLRIRLLENAFSLYEKARGAIEQLPPEASGPIRVAVESYMEIGRTLRQGGFSLKAGRATVPKWRRVMVAWRTLNE